MDIFREKGDVTHENHSAERLSTLPGTDKCKSMTHITIAFAIIVVKATQEGREREREERIQS